MNKKFISPLPSGGVPITSEDFLMIQDELHEALNSLCAGINDAFVISGCDVSFNGFNIAIGAGVVFVDSQVMKFDGYTGSFPCYVKAGTVVKSPRIYKDGFSKDTITQRKAICNTSTSGNGVIKFNPMPEKTLKYSITSYVDGRITQEITDRTNGDTSLNNRITSEVAALTNSINTKLTKTNEAWQNATYNAGTTNFGSGSKPAQYKKTSDGIVFLRGQMSISVSTGGGYTSFTLPAGYRPSQDMAFKTINTSGTVAADGRVMMYTAEAGVWTLDGISFIAEQ
ncbi:hypothetical protein ABID22_000137 [Pontibacter aydingkolensis]|uniref:Uncharacterized protein n=1 Tax=Pontibacter aydingkolensis TaxID=1911536 RepID=A0ABS7CQU6_9BACT|nr:hypothetical protein [Pontibacter aydingkolensis]MBW7466195.1 hypothetical protein [Pontibacter aydingkolensis]